jgi:hypothetical protein
MNDFRILGIAETSDPRLVKEAFRSRAKELHPDHAREGSCEDPMERHLLFVALTQAYRRVMSSLGDARGPGVERRAKAPEAAPKRAQTDTSLGTSLAPHGDPAYAYYKTAMRFYMAIHPSAWTIDPNLPSEPRAARGAGEEEMREKVRKLVRLFPKAYYYFSVVATEYPDSPWAADAMDKMKTIERRTASYKRIIESFGAYKRAGKERGAEISGIVERTKGMLKEEGDLRWPSSPEGKNS